MFWLTVCINTQYFIWAARCENESLGTCGQRRPISACVSAQSDQGLHCPLTESLNTSKWMMERKSSDDTLRVRRIIWICALWAYLNAIFFVVVWRPRCYHATKLHYMVRDNVAGGSQEELRGMDILSGDANRPTLLLLLFKQGLLYD